MDRDACSDSIISLFTKNKEKLNRRKMNSDTFSLLLPNKNKSYLTMTVLQTGKGQSQCKCSSLRNRMGLGRACWLRTEEGSSSGVRNSTRPL